MSDKKLQAKNLYLQTDLNKTQIANLLKISRRSLHYWIREGSWERLKIASETMPSIIAENCYHILRHMSELHLSERRLSKPITPKEVDAMHKMVLTINKLKGRAVLNESMEMFGYFFDKLKAVAPELAEALTPHVDEYLSERAQVHPIHVQPPHLTNIGYIPFDHNQTDPDERQLDNHDHVAWDAERYNLELDERNIPWPKVDIPEEQPLPNPYADILNELQQGTQQQNIDTTAACDVTTCDSRDYPVRVCVTSPSPSERAGERSCHPELVEGAPSEQQMRNPNTPKIAQNPVNTHDSKATTLKKIFSNKLRNAQLHKQKQPVPLCV
ncbi:MAG: hypothetical protein V4649_08480 [Bacteroidota bacterium]